MCLFLLIGTAGGFTASARTKLDVPDRFRLLVGDFGPYGEVNARFPQHAEYAWLEDVMIRESPASILCNDLVPIDDYPFSTTLDGFRRSVKNFLDILGKEKDPVAMFEDFIFIFEQVQIGLRAIGVTASEYEQRVWLEDEYGIIFPNGDDVTIYDSMMTNMLYLLLRFEIGQALFGITDFTVPAGVLLEEAAVAAMKAYLEVNLELDDFDANMLADIVTLNGLVIEVMRTYMETQGTNVPSNASDSEIVSAFIIEMARHAGYTNMPDPGTMLEEQLKAYELGAEIFLRYGVMCEAGAIIKALEAKDPAEALARVILETMVREKASANVVAQIPQMTDEELFTQTLILHYFDLGKNSFVSVIGSAFGSGRRRNEGLGNGRDFYSDIYEYNVQLNYRRSSFYLSAWSFAPLMMPTGSTKNATLKVNGVEAPLARAIKIDLDPDIREQYVDLEVSYVDRANGINQTRHYIFNIFQGMVAPPENEAGLIKNLFDAAGAVGSIFNFPSLPKKPTPTGETTDDYIPGAIMPTIPIRKPSLPQFNTGGSVLGVHTAVHPTGVGFSSPYKAQPKLTGFAAVVDTLKRDHLWLYALVGFVALSTAVTVFIYDQKKQEAQHIAMGFKNKVHTGGKVKKQKPDNRF